MNCPRFRASSALQALEPVRMLYESRPGLTMTGGYGRPPGRPRISYPATYSCQVRLRSNLVDLEGLSKVNGHLYGLVTTTHETSGLAGKFLDFTDPLFYYGIIDI